MNPSTYQLLELPVIYYQEEVFKEVNPQGELVNEVRTHRIVTRGTIDPLDIEAVTGSAGYTDKEHAMKMSCTRLWMKSGHAMEIDLPEGEVRQRWIASRVHNEKITFMMKFN